MMTKDILIVDDEEDIRGLICGILEDDGYATRSCGTSGKAFEMIGEKPPGLVILDIWLQGSEHDGMQILEKISAEHPHLPVIMISGHGTIETAVQAIKLGAYDFIEKPFKADRLLLMTKRALEAAALRQENTALKARTPKTGEVIGTSSFAKSLQNTIKRAGAGDGRILLQGEAGTGKRFIAKLVHENSSRALEEFVTLNCKTLQDLEALEDEGSVLFTNIESLPHALQDELLSCIQKKTVKARIFASTAADLTTTDVRKSLLDQLSVSTITLQPLRARTEDIEPLAAYFTGDARFSPAAMMALKNQPWSGNVAQLKNTVEWMAIHHPGCTRFDLEHLPSQPKVSNDEQTPSAMQSDLLDLPLREARECFERDYLFAQVERFAGNISKTAAFIGMERSALHRKLKSLQLSEEEADTKEIKQRA